jgi:phosphotriesterase-related protein
MHDHTIFVQKYLKLALLLAMPSMITGTTAYQKGKDIQAEKIRRKEEGLDNLPPMSISNVIKSMKMPKNNPASKLSEFDYYCNELKAFVEAGGKSLCDCSPSGQPLNVLQRLSRKSGVQLISCVGFYTKPTIKKALYKDGRKEMRRLLENLLLNGDGTCDGRPGFVKCAISLPEKGGADVSEAELNSVMTCAEAAKEHGMSLHVHTAFPLRKVHILKTADMLENKVGISPNRVLFCHIDSFSLGPGNPSARINRLGYDSSLALELSRRGFHIGLDTWSIGRSDPAFAEFHLSARKAMLLELLKKGCRENITLGHDMMSKANGVQNNNYGYTEFSRVLNQMKQEGSLTEEDITAITVTNPANILAIQNP